MRCAQYEVLKGVVVQDAFPRQRGLGRKNSRRNGKRRSERAREKDSREMEWEFAMMEGGLLLREVLRWSYAYSMSDQKSSAGTREEVGAALKRAERGQEKKLLAPGSSL